MNRTYSGVLTISTSRHAAHLRAKAVRKISRFVFVTAFTSENVVSPICPALEQSADGIANLPAHRFRLPLVRLSRFSGVGFLFILFSKSIEERHFMKRELLFDMQYTARLFGTCVPETVVLRGHYLDATGKPLDQRFEARIQETAAKILEGQYRDRPST